VTVYIPQKSSETNPLSVPKSGRYFNTQKNNLVGGSGAEKVTVTNPQSPAAHTNENINSVPNLDKAPSRGDTSKHFENCGKN